MLHATTGRPRTRPEQKHHIVAIPEEHTTTQVITKKFSRPI
jgi:hypothetical protein